MPRKRTPQSNLAPIRDVNAANRVQAALKLRAQRVKYEDIALQCGYGSGGAAYKAIMRELDRQVSEDVKTLRESELASLDLLEREIWSIFYDKKLAKGRLFAADRILSIKERRAKLMGLDTPVDVEGNSNLVIIRQVPPGYLPESITAPSQIIPENLQESHE